MKDNVSIIGLGYVGLTLAVYLASQGKKVYGIEISEPILQALANGKSTFYEAGFENKLKTVIKEGSFTFGKNYQHFEEDVTFIVTVGTPLAADNLANLGTLQMVMYNISHVLKDGDVVILRSTVKVGTTRKVAKEILDNVKRDYYLGFCPERTVEGSALEELSYLPQIISGIDEPSIKKITDFFAPVFSELVLMNSIEEAEMVKLLNNSERDLMFALANEIALMSEAKGLDAYKIIEAANYRYPRSNLKKPGPVGGPCLEKDPYILTESFIDLNYKPDLFIAGRKINERIVELGLQRFAAEIKTNKNGELPEKIAVIGFAFKGLPPTSDIRGSLVYRLIKQLKHWYPFAQIIGHDYLATLDDMLHAGAAMGTNDIHHALEGADIVILQNNHPQYKNENWRELQKILAQNAMVYDFWNQLDSSVFNDKVKYFAFGRLKHEEA